MRTLFTLILVSVVISLKAQSYISESFELPNDTNRNCFIIDTVHYHNNIWQIGKPNKIVFDSAYSYPSAIVTDTVNHYPIKDTSVFFLKMPPTHYYLGLHMWRVGFSFKYQLDIDSGEIAKVELSADSVHWTDVTDSNLHKSTNGWKNFYYSDAGMTGSLLPYVRFTFISDSVQTNKDGWIMDDFKFDYFYEGVGKIQKNDLISIYPNPSAGDVWIKQNVVDRNATISIFDLNGQMVFETSKIAANQLLNTDLPKGHYLLEYSTDKEFAVKKLEIR